MSSLALEVTSLYRRKPRLFRRYRSRIVFNISPIGYSRSQSESTSTPRLPSRSLILATLFCDPSFLSVTVDKTYALFIFVKIAITCFRHRYNLIRRQNNSTFLTFYSSRFSFAILFFLLLLEGYQTLTRVYSLPNSLSSHVLLTRKHPQKSMLLIS